jgi:DNA-binding CsgD family transcriptional regulator
MSRLLFDRVCTAEVASLRAEPDERAEQVTQVLRGEPLAAEERRDGWVRVRTAYDYVGWLREVVVQGDALAEAHALVGTPYEWGGLSERGLDCSGLVHLAFRRAGRLVPRDAWQQEEVARPVAEDELIGRSRYVRRRRAGRPHRLLARPRTDPARDRPRGFGGRRGRVSRAAGATPAARSPLIPQTGQRSLLKRRRRRADTPHVDAAERKQILSRYMDHQRRFEAAAARRSNGSAEVIPFAPPAREYGQDPTMREIEVLQLISEGLANREIGHRLFLSEETVKSHVRHLLAKLQARSRAHAVAVGFRRGLIG